MNRLKMLINIVNNSCLVILGGVMGISWNIRFSFVGFALKK